MEEHVVPVSSAFLPSALKPDGLSAAQLRLCHNERGISRSNLFPSAVPEGFAGADIPAQALCALLCHYGRNEGTQPACTNGVKQEEGGNRGQRPSFKIKKNSIQFNSHWNVFLFFFTCVFSFFLSLLWISIILHWFGVCFCPFFLVYYLSPTFASFSAPSCTPTTFNLLSVVPVFILFLWSLLN